MAKNPVRNRAIQWVGGGGLTEEQAAAIAASAILNPPITGDPIGDVIDGDLPLVETLPTDETDTSLVPHPSGDGGVEWGADASALEIPVEHGALGATETFDAADGSYHRGTLTAGLTPTLVGLAAGVLSVLTLELLEDGTGGWDVTWPGSIVWASGVAPTLDTTAGATTVLSFWSTDGGSSWFGTAGGGSLTIKDEGVALASPASILDFVGAGVAASGTGATKTITISGTPTAAAVSALGFVGPLVITDTPSTPLVFADILQNEAQDDLIYADL